MQSLPVLSDLNRHESQFKVRKCKKKKKKGRKFCTIGLVGHHKLHELKDCMSVLNAKGKAEHGSCCAKVVF